MSDHNLLDQLGCGGLDQFELEALILSHFGHAAQLSENEIGYGRGGDKLIIRSIYGRKSGQLEKILAEPAFDTDDFEKLKEKVAGVYSEPSVIKAQRVVLFTAVPTDGYYRYKDLFQLLPLPKEAPRPDYLLADHPLSLEVNYKSSSDFRINQLRLYSVLREIELALNVLLRFRVKSNNNISRHYWVFSKTEDMSSLTSEFKQAGYTWPGAKPLLDGFSSVDGIREMSLVEPSTYYNTLGLSPGETLTLPSDLTTVLDRFFSTNNAIRNRFLQSSYWFQHANAVWSWSQSAAFVSIVSAVESLIPDDVPESFCPCCKRPVGAGPTRKFVNFIDQFVPGKSVSVSSRSQFYGMRSALAHGQKLFGSDKTNWPGFTPKRLGEDAITREIWHLVHICIRNWLLKSTDGKSSPVMG